MRSLLVLLAMVLAAGCGNGDSSGDDVPDVPDQVAEDGDATPSDDGGANADDGGGADADGDGDGEVVGTDEDGDTFPEGVDCDDSDPLVYPGTRRDCTSACATGTERCEAGAWVGCTASTDCACDAPGTTRTVDCGDCGLASQRCGDDGVWEMPGTCMSEGECGDADVESEPCTFCGHRSRICDATCHWRDWGACDMPSECDPSSAPETTTEGCPSGQIRQRSCSSSCEWVDSVPCTGDCILPPRAATILDDEVCITGGPFLMGTDIAEFIEDDNTPVHTVTLTPFLIDKYKVTNRRYRACVDAGVCAPPRLDPEPPWAENWVTYHFEPVADWQDYPVSGVTHADAVAFCAWDGGRLLPTEAQWEKAAKGPAPRQVPYPWGADPDPCPYVNLPDCSTGTPEPADGHPEGASYYGVFQMDGNYHDWVRDWYDADYYSASPDVDPPGSVTGTYRIRRGAEYWWSVSPHASIAHRAEMSAGYLSYGTGFRCSRIGY